MAITVDETKLKTQSEALKQSLEYYNKFAAPVVYEYTHVLDEMIEAVNTKSAICRQNHIEIDILTLQQMVLDLSSTMYFVSDKYEQLSLMADMAKISYKDKYNEAYLAKQSAARQEDRKYTADQLRAIANQDAVEEELIQFMYEHAAAIVKNKLEYAVEVQRSLSKSLSAQIESMKKLGVN